MDSPGELGVRTPGHGFFSCLIMALESLGSESSMKWWAWGAELPYATSGKSSNFMLEAITFSKDCVHICSCPMRCNHNYKLIIHILKRR